MRKKRSRIAAHWGKAILMILSLSASGMVAAAPEKVIRTPQKFWNREYDEGSQRLILSNNSRIAAIDMQIADAQPTRADVMRLLQPLIGQAQITSYLRWPESLLQEQSLQMAVKITLSDGRKAMFASMWKRRLDGKLGIASYLTVANEYGAENVADFKLVRSLANQLARGSVLVPTFVAPPPEIIAAVPDPVLALPAAAPVPVVAPPVAVAASAAVPAVATVPILVPVPAAPIPVPPLLTSAAAVPAAVSTAKVAVGYPFVTLSGSGVPLGQIASLLYAPLESSEVFVLFKDGSFHENLPVALEQWNLGASRSDDPSSWGKWKNATEEGDFELRYAEDDIVTISATKIKPAKNGLVLEGRYELGGNDAAKGEISFSGDRFEIIRAGITDTGTYKVEGYSVILRHDNGTTEHQPFFFVPLDEEGEGDEEPAIWLGDRMHQRLD